MTPPTISIVEFNNRGKDNTPIARLDGKIILPSKYHRWGSESHPIYGSIWKIQIEHKEMKFCIGIPIQEYIQEEEFKSLLEKYQFHPKILDEIIIFCKQRDAENNIYYDEMKISEIKEIFISKKPMYDPAYITFSDTEKESKRFLFADYKSAGEYLNNLSVSFEKERKEEEEKQKERDRKYILKRMPIIEKILSQMRGRLNLLLGQIAEVPELTISEVFSPYSAFGISGGTEHRQPNGYSEDGMRREFYTSIHGGVDISSHGIALEIKCSTISQIQELKVSALEQRQQLLCVSEGTKPYREICTEEEAKQLLSEYKQDMVSEARKECLRKYQTKRFDYIWGAMLEMIPEFNRWDNLHFHFYDGSRHIAISIEDIEKYLEQAKELLLCYSDERIEEIITRGEMK